jgi:hypothetical protein
MAITAVLFAALMPTPQFSHSPPVKLASVLDPLVTVVSTDPLMRSTLVLFSVQTTSPVTEFPAHEFTKPVVGKFNAETPVPSNGTRSIPVAPEPSHEPNGMKAVTFDAAGLPATIARELVGTQAARVVLVAVTVISEQLGVLNVLNEVDPAVPVTHTKYVPDVSDAGIRNSKRRRTTASTAT